jgi:DNA-binding LacI/PurR family transcriptional regulator
LNALRGQGVRVPRELTVIGFDDIATAAWEAFALTTVSQDLPRMVEAAVGGLLERIAGDAAPPRRVRIAPRLVERGTHGPPPPRR